VAGKHAEIGASNQLVAHFLRILAEITASNLRK